MGVRFQKRVSLGKGSGLNISKSGVSFSQRTAFGSIGTRGYSIKTGIPGLYIRNNWKSGKGRASTSSGSGLVKVFEIAGLASSWLLFWWLLIPFYLIRWMIRSISRPKDRKVAMQKLLNLNFSKLDRWMEEGEPEENTAGQMVRKFYKKGVKPKVFDMFDYIQMNLFEDGQKNVTLYTSKFDEPSPEQLKVLVDKLYRIWGKDEGGLRGHHSSELFPERMWLKKGANLSYNQDDEGNIQYQLTLFGV